MQAAFTNQQQQKYLPKIPSQTSLFVVSLQHSLKLPHEGKACYQCCSTSFQFKIKRAKSTLHSKLGISEIHRSPSTNLKNNNNKKKTFPIYFLNPKDSPSGS